MPPIISPTDLDCAIACYYDYFNPEWFDLNFSVDGDVGGLKPQTIAGKKSTVVSRGKRIADDTMLVVMRGSDTALDWWRDFNFRPDTDPNLGEVDGGFMEGMRAVWWAIRPLLPKHVILAGHSLGAARSMLLAGLMTSGGQPPDHVITFGCPKPGCDQLKQILAPVDIHSYRNLTDEVTDLPPWIFEPGRGYEQMRDFIELSCQSPSPWLPFGTHHIQMYITGLILKDH